MFRKLFLGSVLACAASVVGFFLLIKVIDFNEYKPRIQKEIKEKIGYDIHIKGDITFSLSPVGISITDVDIKNPHYDPMMPFATLKSFDVALEIAPLLRKEVKVKYISLENLTLILEKNKQGMFNFEAISAKKEKISTDKEGNATVEKELELPLVNINKIHFYDAKVLWRDHEKDTNASVEALNLTIKDIHVDATKHHRIQSLFFNVEAYASKLSYAQYVLSGLAMKGEMKEAILSVDSLKYTLFDSLVQGSLKLDVSGKVPKVSLKHKASSLNLSALSQNIFPKVPLDGVANAEAKLSFSLGDAAQFKHTLNGFVHIAGEKITLKGYAIDSMIEALNDPKILSEQLLFFGREPAEGITTLLKQLVSHVDIGYGKINLEDVAFSSAQHRVALRGALQMVEEKFLDLNVAIIDKNGCTTFEQTVVGTFAKPMLKVDKTMAKNLINSALSLLEKTETKEDNATKKEACTPVYKGSIKHPL